MFKTKPVGTNFALSQRANQQSTSASFRVSLLGYYLLFFFCCIDQKTQFVLSVLVLTDGADSTVDFYGCSFHRVNFLIDLQILIVL